MHDSRLLHCEGHRAARPQPNVAKRLECVQLAAALEPRRAFDSGSKLHALQTLRDIRCPPISSQPANNFDYCSAEPNPVHPPENLSLEGDWTKRHS
jgi:hypothetical protein